MSQDFLVERMFETLITGNRPAARQLVAEAMSDGVSPAELLTDLFWPTYQMIDRLYRSDQLACLNHHLATRMLRVLVDQTSAKIAKSPSRGRSIFVACGPSDSEELGAQMAVDLLEGMGFGVTFAGGGTAGDELLAHIQDTQPDVLLMFCSAPTDLPAIREMIDTLREIGACADIQIAVGGGVFNRAEGLAEEVGADLWATDPLAMVEQLVNEPGRRAGEHQRTVGKTRKRRAA